MRECACSASARIWSPSALASESATMRSWLASAARAATRVSLDCISSASSWLLSASACACSASAVRARALLRAASSSAVKRASTSSASARILAPSSLALASWEVRSLRVSAARASTRASFDLVSSALRSASATACDACAVCVRRSSRVDSSSAAIFARAWSASERIMSPFSAGVNQDSRSPVVSATPSSAFVCDFLSDRLITCRREDSLSPGRGGTSGKVGFLMPPISLMGAVASTLPSAALALAPAMAFFICSRVKLDATSMGLPPMKSRAMMEPSSKLTSMSESSTPMMSAYAVLSCARSSASALGSLAMASKSASSDTNVVSCCPVRLSLASAAGAGGDEKGAPRGGCIAGPTRGPPPRGPPPPGADCRASAPRCTRVW